MAPRVAMPRKSPEGEREAVNQTEEYKIDFREINPKVQTTFASVMSTNFLKRHGFTELLKKFPYKANVEPKKNPKKFKMLDMLKHEDIMNPYEYLLFFTMIVKENGLSKEETESVMFKKFGEILFGRL
ncbi:hypothetical protein HAX54_037985 [Datura stramonium]|uniref:Uncharacterized protein n=1 Tax=Datura stramonium TaxID=4076 RepID=A0ABS8SHF8_DATST|nr:hypothetical protein [Datura stramonium]